MARVSIAGGGRSVEVDDPDSDLHKVRRAAVRIWRDTAPARPAPLEGGSYGFQTELAEPDARG